MTELSRNLLAAAREGLAPDPAVAARVRARVAAAVGATAAVAPVKASATASAAAKIGGALLAVGLIVGALAVLPRSSDRTQVPQLGTTTIEDEPTARAHEVAVASQPAVPAPAVALDPPARSLATLAREVELIDRAMLALRRGAAPAALEAIATFDRETRGHGQMAEDAAAVAIEARCSLHHDVAERLAAFDREYPSSAQRARLRDACR